MPNLDIQLEQFLKGHTLRFAMDKEEEKARLELFTKRLKRLGLGYYQASDEKLGIESVYRFKDGEIRA